MKHISLERNSSGKIYRAKISKGGEIIRDFIPCADYSYSPCLYEKITNKVYYYDTSSYDAKVIIPDTFNGIYSLPANYKECIYLQSNGTQYIDTGIVPDNNTGIFIKAQHLGYADTPPIGAWQSSSVYFYPPRFNTSSKGASWAFGSKYQSMFSYDSAGDLIYKSWLNYKNSKLLKLDSDDTDWTGSITFDCGNLTRSLWLFSYNMDDTAINATYGKYIGRVYRCQITSNNNIIRDFIPCLDENDNPCMYDLVTQTPYYKQGGNEEFAYCVKHQLPSDFIKLDYLESDISQYIKTDYVPTNNTGLYVDCYNTYKRTDWAQPFALRQTNGNTYISAGRVQKATNGAGFGWNAYTTPGGTGNVRYEATLNWLNDKKSIITAPAFAQRVNTLNDLTFTPTIDLCLFGCHNYDGKYMTASYRIYRAKISEGSEIVRDYVPAYDALKDKPCMYDLINNVAYYNDGTGEFVMPPKREGSYTGFAQLGGIGNRLGGGEIIFGEEDYTLFRSFNTIDPQDSTPDQLYLGYGNRDSRFYPRKIKFQIVQDDFGWFDDDTLLMIFGRYPWTYVSEPCNGISYHPIDKFFLIRNAENSTLCQFQADNTKIHEIYTDGINVVYNNKIINLEWVECDIVGSRDDSEIFIGPYEMEMKVYSAELYSPEGELLTSLTPIKDQNLRGMYCSVRNINLLTSND